MRVLYSFIVLLLVVSNGFAQTLFMESNLDGVVLDIGETFKADTFITDLDGNKTICNSLIYYVKDGAFNVGNAIEIDPIDGIIKAQQPGSHEVVAVCVGMDDGNRLSQTFKVTVNYPKTIELDFETMDNIFVGENIEAVVKILSSDGYERVGNVANFVSSDPEVIKVDLQNNLIAIGKGTAVITARIDGVEKSKKIIVSHNPVSKIEIYSDDHTVRTGDVVNIMTLIKDKKGNIIDGINPHFSFSGISNDVSSSASGLINNDGDFVADSSGLYTIYASIGNFTASMKINVVDRNSAKEMVQLSRGEVTDRRTSDAWFFEGTDGRDYGISGTWGSDGTFYVWDVTDPSEITKVNSVTVDARIVNDVKISEDGKIGVISREGASNRKNGIIILDISNPKDIQILSEYSKNLTGGVHNIFIYDNHVYALNAFANPSKFFVINIDNPSSPYEVGSFQVDEAGSAIHDVWIENGIAYSSNWKHGVSLIDVGNGVAGGSPSNPVEIGNYRYASGANHAAFPFKSKSTGKFYVIAGDEIFPEGVDGDSPNETAGFLHFIDFTDLNNPKEVARYEVPGHGSHNFWVEDDMLFIGMYTAGVRVVDISGDLMGDLYKQGREIASFNTGLPNGYVANSPMAWGAQFFKETVFYSDFFTGIGALKILDKPIDNSNTNQFKTDKTLDEALGAKNLFELFEIISNPPLDN